MDEADERRCRVNNASNTMMEHGYYRNFGCGGQASLVLRDIKVGFIG
jgi:hypothetical protein